MAVKQSELSTSMFCVFTHGYKLLDYYLASASQLCWQQCMGIWVRGQHAIKRAAGVAPEANLKY